ncbi:MAG: VOC family protein, partial [Acidobacteria bacterium]|nr:VOC family protein [Acidobacteriota bacterium]
MLFAVLALAQTAPPNAQGVAMGHLHLNTRDPQAVRQFWTALGASTVKLGPMEGYKIRGMLVFVRRADAAGGTEGSVIGHIGLAVRDLKTSLARWKAAGIRIESEGARQAFLAGPDGLRVEISEAPALPAEIACHHLHFYNRAVLESRGWYAKMFGAIPGRRGRFEAADLPGVNLSFSDAPAVPAPTKGRALDHIGFEVRNLPEFCKRLEAAGVRFDVPYRKVPARSLA